MSQTKISTNSLNPCSSKLESLLQLHLHPLQRYPSLQPSLNLAINATFVTSTELLPSFTGFPFVSCKSRIPEASLHYHFSIVVILRKQSEYLRCHCLCHAGEKLERLKRRSTLAKSPRIHLFKHFCVMGFKKTAGK